MIENFKEKILIAQDRVTGFKGTVIGFCTYTTGCDQYLLAPKVADNGDFKESRWFDASRLEIISTESEVNTLQGESNGSDIAAPSKSLRTSLVILKTSLK